MRYKYWLFYLNQDDDEYHDLYAYTDNKEYANRFKEERDMDKFVCVKKKLTKAEVNFLADEYQTNILEEMMLQTSDKDNNIIKTSMIGTKIEKLTINNEATRFMVCGIYEYCWVNPEIFQKELYDALEILEYNNIYSVLSTTGHQSISHGFKPNIEVDELAIFIHNFGKSLKVKEKDNHE